MSLLELYLYYLIEVGLYATAISYSNTPKDHISASVPMNDYYIIRIILLTDFYSGAI